jgi:hypothetical protein
MRNQNLGDSLDLAKRAVLHRLHAYGIRTLVAPLPCQPGFDFSLYGKILDIPPDEVFGDGEVRFSGRKRSSHLEALRAALLADSWDGLLMDPDSGLSRERTDSPKYLSAAELAGVVADWSGLWVVYHHQATDGLGYETASQAVGGRFYHDFGKAVLIAGGQATLAGKLREALRAKLHPQRVRDVGSGTNL